MDKIDPSGFGRVNNIHYRRLEKIMAAQASTIGMEVLLVVSILVMLVVGLVSVGILVKKGKLTVLYY